jgi:hypothetical protein
MTVNNNKVQELINQQKELQIQHMRTLAHLEEARSREEEKRPIVGAESAAAIQSTRKRRKKLRGEQTLHNRQQGCYKEPEPFPGKPGYSGDNKQRSDHGTNRERGQNTEGSQKPPF